MNINISSDDLKERNLVSNGYEFPYNPDLISRARKFRKNMTKEEFILWSKFLRKMKPRFLRQKVVDNYILDFYCAKKKVAVEVDGKIHNSEVNKEYDLIRDSVLNEFGIFILRIPNHRITNEFSLVCEEIKNLLI